MGNYLVDICINRELRSPYRLRSYQRPGSTIFAEKSRQARTQSPEFLGKQRGAERLGRRFKGWTRSASSALS